METAVMHEGLTVTATPPRVAQPAPEPQDIAAAMSGANALELVVEMAHDLRSPLSAILFLSEALQRGESGEVNETQRSQLGLIYSAALTLCNTASDVLEMARGGDRLLDRTPVRFSLQEVRTWVRDLVVPVAEQKGVSFRFETLEPDMRLGHPRALSRVLLNLATNGLRATDRGYVAVSARARGADHVLFTVEDTGPGLDASAVRDLYQPWRRRNASRYEFSGTGLGLAICRKLVAAMGSTLNVESRHGRGTKLWFEVRLPPAYPAD